MGEEEGDDDVPSCELARTFLVVVEEGIKKCREKGILNVG